MFFRSRMKAFMVAALAVYIIFTLVVLIQMDINSNSTVRYSDYDQEETAQHQLANGSSPSTKLKLTPKETWAKLAVFKDTSQSIGRLKSRISKVTFNFTSVGNETYVYSAFLDRRQRNASYVRLVALARSGQFKNWSALWCHFPGLPQSSSVASRLLFYETCESHLKEFAFYYMSCRLPNIKDMNAWTREEVIVATGAEKTGLQTGIRVPVIHYDWVERKGRPWDKGHDLSNPVTFALCVPPVFGNLEVADVVESLEIAILLGVNHITFYDNEMSEELRAALTLYERQGLATVLPWFLPQTKVWYKGQSAAIADCLFRNMYAADLVAFHDVDEVIFPHTGQNWKTMIQSLFNDSLSHNQNTSQKRWEDVAAYSFQSAFFVTPLAVQMSPEKGDLPRPPAGSQTLHRLARTKTFSLYRTKVIADPVRVFELGIHHLSKPAQEHWQALSVPLDVGYVHHYSKCQKTPGVNCREYMMDSSALAIQPLLRQRVEARLWQISISK